MIRLTVKKSFSMLLSVIFIIGAFPACSANYPEEKTQANSSYAVSQTSAFTNSMQPMIIGVEYSSPGMALSYKTLGITGVKHYPDAFSWSKMQSSKTAAVNFTAMDKYITEYQNAGFKNAMLSLKPSSSWASKNVLTNFSPQIQYIGLFDNWITAVVERYDKDGYKDMAGLKYPVNIIEIGIEFSSYEPEPAADYVWMLEHAYKAAHAASNTVKILNSAFLVSLAFKSNPAPGGYEAAFAAVDKRIMFHTLADIRKVLDRPDIFDMVNFHALSYPSEIEDTVKWLNYEMQLRNYTKPVFISDTSVNPFSGYGSALVTKGTAATLSVLSPPAKETDRSRLKTYFTSLINKNTAALNWVHAFCATDTVKKIVMSAGQGVYQINAAFMEEYEPSKALWFGAAAGNSSWSGITQTTVKNIFTGERAIKETRASFYAIKQLNAHLNGYTAIERISTADKSIRIYKVTNSTGFFYVAWYEPDTLILPGDTVPAKTADVSGLGSAAKVENIISAQGQTVPAAVNYATTGGTLAVSLTYFPCYIIPA